MASPDAKLGIEQLFAASDITPYPVNAGARVSMEIASYRPIRYASRVRCPTLVIACTHDDLTPSWPAEQVVKRIGSAARLVRTDLGHFEIYVHEGFEFTRAEHLEFLRRVLPVELDSAHVPRAEASRTGL